MLDFIHWHRTAFDDPFIKYLCSHTDIGAILQRAGMQQSHVTDLYIATNVGTLPPSIDVNHRAVLQI